MAVVRLEALRAFRDELERRLRPELAGRIFAMTPNDALARPRLSIRPISARYMPEQACEHRPRDAAGNPMDPAPDTVVMRVGWHEVTIQMRLEHDTPELRAELQGRIQDAFLETPGLPGTIIVPVLRTASVGRFFASFDLDDDEWTDDLAFNDEYESLITVTGYIPALVLRREAHKIRDLRMGISQEFNVAWNDPSVRVVRVNGDGSITPL